MKYMNIELKTEDEFNYARLKQLVDEIRLMMSNDYISIISKIEDYKGILTVYWKREIPHFLKMIIDVIWMDDFNEEHVNHNINVNKSFKIKCLCCNKLPQQEDEEIIEYIKKINDVKSKVD